MCGDVVLTTVVAAQWWPPADVVSVVTAPPLLGGPIWAADEDVCMLKAVVVIWEFLSVNEDDTVASRCLSAAAVGTRDVVCCWAGDRPVGSDVDDDDFPLLDDLFTTCGVVGKGWGDLGEECWCTAAASVAGGGLFAVLLEKLLADAAAAGG